MQRNKSSPEQGIDIPTSPNEELVRDRTSSFTVQLVVDMKPLRFVRGGTTTQMTFDEIKLVREIGSVSVAGISYSVKDIAVDIAENASGCRYMVIINLTKNY